MSKEPTRVSINETSDKGMYVIKEGLEPLTRTLRDVTYSHEPRGRGGDVVMINMGDADLAWVRKLMKFLSSLKAEKLSIDVKKKRFISSIEEGLVTAAVGYGAKATYAGLVGEVDVISTRGVTSDVTLGFDRLWVGDTSYGVSARVLHVTAH